MRSNSSVGLKPSGPTSLVSLSICCLIPATRISKNSSRFELKIVRNLTRSMSGCVGSCASSRTRRLNASQLSSRLMKFFGSPKRSRMVWTTSGTAVASLFSSVRGVAGACGMFNDCRSAAHAQRAISDGDRHALVPDVFRCRGVNGVLGNILSMIADALKSARDQEQVKIPVQLLSILHHSRSKFLVCITIHLVECLVATADRVCQLDIFTHICVDAILEHRHCVRLHGHD